MISTNPGSVAMIFLADNILLEEQLVPEHIKPRLLGAVLPYVGL